VRKIKQVEGYPVNDTATSSVADDLVAVVPTHTSWQGLGMVHAMLEGQKLNPQLLGLSAGVMITVISMRLLRQLYQKMTLPHTRMHTVATKVEVLAINWLISALPRVGREKVYHAASRL
jgi:hypothetical protein